MGCLPKTKQTTKATTPQTLSKTSRKARNVQMYFPLKLGYRWVYRVRSTSDKQTARHVFRVVRKKGNVWYDNTKPYPETYQYDPWGLKGKNRYLIKYPLEVGTKWISFVSFRVEHYEIISMGRSLRVPFGYFSNCLVVRSREKQKGGKILEALFYYAPRVGLVKIQTQLIGNSKTIPQWSLALESFLPATN